MTCLSNHLDYSLISTTVLGYLSTKKEEDGLQEVVTRFFLSLESAYFSIPDKLPTRYSVRLKKALHFMETTTKSNKNRFGKKMLKCVFDSTTQFLYREFDLSKKKFHILVTGVVTNDGMGDYFHMVHAAEKLEKAFPGATITIGAEVEKLKSRRDRFFLSKFSTILWGIQKKESPSSIDFEDPIEGAEERAKCLRVAETASLVLDLPHMSYESSIRDDVPESVPYLRLVEYGSSSFLRTDYIDGGMGVAPCELGLIWKTPQSLEEGVSSISDTRLNTFLLQRETLSDSALSPSASYRQTHVLHFAYLHADVTPFIKICLAYNRENEVPFIDIVVPEKFMTELAVQSYLEPLEEQGYLSQIKEVHTFQKDLEKGTLIFKSKQISETGKTLRLINPFPLPNEDVQRLILLSSGCVGCTGDLSVSEVFASERLPFYRAPRHKSRFLDSILNVAKDLFQSSDSPLVNYLSYLKRTSFYKTQIEEIGKLLQNKSLYKEMGIFSAHLKAHYDFDEVLVDLVSRVFVQEEVPGLKKKSQKMFNAYTKKKQSLVSCYEEYQSSIKAFQPLK